MKIEDFFFDLYRRFNFFSIRLRNEIFLTFLYPFSIFRQNLQQITMHA